MNHSSSEFTSHLRPALPGILFIVLTLFFGYVWGIGFGVNEDGIKNRLKASAVAVKDTVYHGDEAAISATVGKAWTMIKRAHIHGAGLGAANLGLILLIVLLGTPPILTRILGLALGIGGLGYAHYWMFAGFRTPIMGGSGPAKESMAWLAMPSAALVVLATFVTVILVIVAIFRTRACVVCSLIHGKNKELQE